MKRLSVLILVLLAVLCSGCAFPKRVDPGYGNQKLRQKLFLNKLPTDKDGDPIYPDSYAGDYWWQQDWFFAVTDLNCMSEYQYLKGAYPEIKFIEHKYSYNYLQSLLDEYEASGGMLPGEYLMIDCIHNIAVVEVDKEHFEEKIEKYFDENIPLKFIDRSTIMYPA